MLHINLIFFNVSAFHVFGSTGKLGVELAVIGFLLGTCIAFFVVIGDLGPAIISSTFGLHKTDTLRTSILVGKYHKCLIDCRVILE